MTVIDDDLISVIMSVYNEPIEYIKAAIDSILRQTYRNIEFIIVNDNPRRSDISEYLDSIQDTRVKRYVNDSNRGLVFSLNRAIQACTGRYIARMDADDISDAKRLEYELNKLIKDNYDLVGCNTIHIDIYGNKIGRTVYPSDEEKIYRAIRHMKGIPHPSWLAKAEVYHTLSGYRNIDKVEDYDFLIRCVLEKYRIGCVSEPLLYYRKNPNGISSTGKALQKYTAIILKSQLSKKRLLDENEIERIIEANIDIIKIWEKGYLFSAFWGDAIRNRYFPKLKDMPKFDIRYVSIVINNISARLS